MRLLVIRHAIAAERVAFAGSDDRLRPLTVAGRRKMERASRGLAAAVPDLDLLASSPLVRARQTAEIVGCAYPKAPQRAETEALVPGAAPVELLEWLRRQGAGTVAVVGHEPSLSLAVSWLLAAVDRPFLGFKKGGAAFLELPDPADAGSGTLLWLLTPSQLRRWGS